MPIQILPPILANQIAAGEVVERPASIIKELVENSLDAGATRIEIELEKGGCQLIRIRDNGSGIPADELQLALARHATSKVQSLDDLNQIMSLGFRGEALASISSVSRLKLTTRTVAQQEAWQAYAEGREMAVTVKPASHPVGTTVEVQDVFFNTPARRRFLKSEKTEFGHIDEWLRRLALSRFDVALSLKHNGKLIRQYRMAESESQQRQRLANACGNEFAQQALAFQNQHLGMSLHGWVMHQPMSSIVDLQYCYVNGRVMRDKLLMHAVRQAYTEAFGEYEPNIAYVVYLTIDPREVDVNVHPAKHEVRFHESRQVHDYFVRVIKDVLLSSEPNRSEKSTLSIGLDDAAVPITPLQFQSPMPSENHTGANSAAVYSKEYSPREVREYSQVYDRFNRQTESSMEQTVEIEASPLLRQQYISMTDDDKLYFIDLKKAYIDYWYFRCADLLEDGLKAQPLLVPVRIQFPDFTQLFAQWASILEQLGIRINQISSDKLAVYAVPEVIRHRNLAELIPQFFKLLLTQDANQLSAPNLLKLLLGLLPVHISVQEIEQAQKDVLQWLHQQTFVWGVQQGIATVIDIDVYIEALRRE